MNKSKKSTKPEISRRESNDAKRRQPHAIGLKATSTVDMDFPGVDLHSENSFSPACPELVCFYCFDVDEALHHDGLTTIVDGNKIWKELPLSHKEIFQSIEIIYEFNLDLNSKIKGKGIRNWFYEGLGVSETKLDLDNNQPNMKYQVY